MRRELSDLEREGAGRAKTAGHAEREQRQRQLAGLRARLKRHPCHACNEREAHARWAERWWRLKRETDELRRQIEGRTGLIATVFVRVTEVLAELGYLE